MQIAVLRNPGSSGNAGRAEPEVPHGVTAIALTGIEALPRTLHDLARQKVELLVIDGGDGTVREILSQLTEIFGDHLPMIGIMVRGNTNLVARKLGQVSGYDALAGWVERPASDLATHARLAPLLRIDGLREGPLRGFIAGWGAYAAGTRIAVEEISARGGRQVIRAVLAVLRRVLVGREAGALQAGVDVRVSPSEHPAFNGAGFSGMMTVLEGRLVAGLSPFWGTGRGAIRWTYIAAPPRRLALAAPFLAFGRPMGWMRRAGYASGRSATLELNVAGGLVVDGEIFPTRPDQRLEIRADEMVRIVAL